MERMRASTLKEPDDDTVITWDVGGGNLFTEATGEEAASPSTESGKPPGEGGNE